MMKLFTYDYFTKMVVNARILDKEYSYIVFEKIYECCIYNL